MSCLEVCAQTRSCSGFDFIFVTAALRWIGVELAASTSLASQDGAMGRTSLSAPVVEYVTPAPPVIAAPVPAEKYIARAPPVIAAPAPGVEDIASAPARIAVFAPVVECFASVIVESVVPTLAVSQHERLWRSAPCLPCSWSQLEPCAQRQRLWQDAPPEVCRARGASTSRVCAAPAPVAEFSRKPETLRAAETLRRHLLNCCCEQQRLAE